MHIGSRNVETAGLPADVSVKEFLLLQVEVGTAV